MLQDETCPKCGQPIWLCRSSSNNVQFRVESDTCFADRAMKEKEDRNKPKGQKKASKEEKAEWGKFYYTVPYVPPTADGEMPTRMEYYDSLKNRQ